MIDEKRIEIYKKISYFSQSSFSSIQVYKNLITNRKLDLSNNILFKIIEDITEMLKYYAEINGNINIIASINNKLQLILEGYKNIDYYLIRDVLEYEIEPFIDEIFDEMRKDIYNYVQ